MQHFEAPLRVEWSSATGSPGAERGSHGVDLGGLARQRQLLAGSASEVLEKIMPGDPLGLGMLLGVRLRERALFLDFERMSLYVFAQVARLASDWDGRGGLDRWLRAQVDAALDAALGEQQQEPPVWSQVPGDEVTSETFSQLAAPLGLDPEDVSAACARFHGLDAAVREAFYLLVVEGCSLDHASQLGAPSAPQLARDARLALDVLRGSRTRNPSNPPLARQSS